MMINNNINKIFNLLYIFLSLFLFYSIFSYNKRVINISNTICIYLLFKWITGYEKCTISYIECKLRDVKKEKGYIYNFLDKIIKLNKSKHMIYLYPIVFYILQLNLKKKIV